MSFRRDSNEDSQNLHYRKRVPHNEPPKAPATERLRYLMVLPVQFRRISEEKFCGESAFVEHVRALRAQLADQIDELVILAPEMADKDYDTMRGALAEVDTSVEPIRFVPLCGASKNRLAFLFFEYGPALKKIWSQVRKADVIHSGTSHNVFRPIEFPALLFAFLMQKPTISVADIDLRNDARMQYDSGSFSRKSFLISRFFYDPIRNAQLRWVSRHCSLVLLKGEQFAAEFDCGKGNVHAFLNSAFSTQQIVAPGVLQLKLDRLASGKPLRIAYFGRLVPYKGIDHAIRALRVLKDRGRTDFSMEIIGSGAGESRLKSLVQRLKLSDHVNFRGAVSHSELFSVLYDLDVLVATPLSEDTPRSALDAMAAGMGIVSYDTYYYRELATSGAVSLAPWGNVEAIADRIAEFDEDRTLLMNRIKAGVQFAEMNTQEIWLRRRIGWTEELLHKLYVQRVNVTEPGI